MTPYRLLFEISAIHELFAFFCFFNVNYKKLSKGTKKY